MGVHKAKQGTFDAPFERLARWALAHGVHPNHLTFAQVPVFLAEVYAATQGWNWVFVGLILFIMVLDGGDGILARTGNLQSRKGAVLDSTFDTLGIAVVVWGATQFYPEAETWLFLLFLLNTLLFLQNALLEEKMVSYVRGPLILSVAWPGFLFGALLLASFLVLWLLIARLPKTFGALGDLTDPMH